MKFCYNTNFTLPKQSQRSRSVLQDGSRSLGLFWKEKTPSYNRRNTVCSQTYSTFSNNAILCSRYDVYFVLIWDFSLPNQPHSRYMRHILVFWDCFGRGKFILWQNYRKPYLFGYKMEFPPLSRLTTTN